MELSAEHMVDMEIVKKSLIRFFRWKYSWLSLIILVNIVLHFCIINQPAQLMFDEQHYVPDGRNILWGEGSQRFEHPPLGKLLIAAGMLIFGDNPSGWRFFPIMFGLFGILLFFLVCRALHLGQLECNIATFLFSFENLTFVQASIAMLDVFSVTFMLAAFWLYLKGKYPLCGLCMGLAILAKLTAVFSVPAIILHWLIIRRDRPVIFTGSIMLAAAVFIALLCPLNYLVFHKFNNPLNDIRTMVVQSESIKYINNTHPSKSRPWEWLYLPLIMPYWWSPHYLGAISFTIWVTIIPAVAYAVWRVFQKVNSSAAMFVLTWFISTYVVYIPLVLVTDRVTYVYYFYPAVGAICLATGMVLGHLLEVYRLRRGKTGKAALGFAVSFMTVHLIIFAVLGPFYSWKLG